MAGKRYSGSGMVNINTYKRFNGTGWVNCVGKRWDGTKWVIFTRNDQITGVFWTYGETGLYKDVFLNIQTTYPNTAQYRIYDVTSQNWIRDWNVGVSSIYTGKNTSQSFTVEIEVRYANEINANEVKRFSFQSSGGGTVES